MIIKREMQGELIQMAKEYPVVTLLGPRQAGKTTLVQAAFPDKPYINLEIPENRELAEEDPRCFFAKYPDGAIIDEVQRAPKLLSYIQAIVDEKKQNGFFILTGSHHLSLHGQVTQSLAGRTAILYLLPLSIAELSAYQDVSDENQLMHAGFLPRVYDEKQNPFRAYRNYLQTYVERDVRQLINIKDLDAFQKFIKVCASRVGQLINYDDISREVGISNITIKSWLSILEASFIIYRLQPYYANIGKRMVKTPKLYFVEVGLAAYLLGIETVEQISRDPLRGQLFENMVVMELVKRRCNIGLDPNLYFYRDQQKHEVNLIYKRAYELIPIEIKSGRTYNRSFLKEIDYFSQLFPDQCTEGYLVYSGGESQKIGWRQLLNFSEAGSIVV